MAQATKAACAVLAAMVTVGEKLGNALLEAALDREAELDRQLQNIDEGRDTEDDYEALRKKRMEAMKANHKRCQELKALGHGEYQEIFETKQFFKTAKESKLLVCHFYRESTFRCKIVDMHLDILAKKHLKTRFVKIDITKNPYLAEKLNIIMLPTVSFIKDGKVLYSMIGFDDVGEKTEEGNLSGYDEFETEKIERLMIDWTVIEEE
jgi:hypothetical protein